MRRKAILAIGLIFLGILAGLFVFKSEPSLNSNFSRASDFIQSRQFRLGLDLSGGSHLVYKADVSALEGGQIGDSMEALRDVIERRVNLFGVSEPIVQVKAPGFIVGDDNQLIVDLPGVTDVEEAIKMIGQTPLLEFKVEGPNSGGLSNAKVNEDGILVLDPESGFINTELTGRYLKRATLEFNPNNRQPLVMLQFDPRGTELFAQITKENVGKIVAIYLDGSPISTPVVREIIPNGEAVISGDFSPEEAKILVGRLNSGALPVPITLISKQTIGATLGENAVAAGVRAAIIGFLLVITFLVLWYRLPGVVAVFSLCIFITIVLSLFKLIPVVLTASGIAGFIISIGLAVDANVLIFERVKEEIRSGKSIPDAVTAGFSRAWFSIRDSNISGLISAVILFWFGTSLIKGFALTLGIGILVSMFSAVVVTRIFLSLFSFLKANRVVRFLFLSGLAK